MACSGSRLKCAPQLCLEAPRHSALPPSVSPPVLTTSALIWDLLSPTSSLTGLTPNMRLEGVKKKKSITRNSKLAFSSFGVAGGFWEILKFQFSKQEVMKGL